MCDDWGDRQDIMDRDRQYIRYLDDDFYGNCSEWEDPDNDCDEEDEDDDA